MCFLHLLQFVRSIISNLPWMRDQMSIEKVMFAFCFCFCFLLWSDVCYYSFYTVNVIEILDLPPLLQILYCQSIIIWGEPLISKPYWLLLNIPSCRKFLSSLIIQAYILRVWKESQQHHICPFKTSVQWDNRSNERG